MGEWGRGGRGARTRFGPLRRYFWLGLGAKAAAAASELTWATWGRSRHRAGLLGGGAAPQRRSACRPHLLASVSSDEDRYVNPFAAGKWRAGPEQRPRSRDAAQEAEAGGGADPGRLVGAPAGARGWRDQGGRASPAAFPSAPPRRLRVASVLAGLLVCALGLLDSFELGTRWRSLSEKAFLL